MDLAGTASQIETATQIRNEIIGAVKAELTAMCDITNKAGWMTLNQRAAAAGWTPADVRDRFALASPADLPKVAAALVAAVETAACTTKLCGNSPKIATVWIDTPRETAIHDIRNSAIAIVFPAK